MEKNHLSIKKVVKNLRNWSKIKTLGTCSINCQFVSCCSSYGEVKSYKLEISNNAYFYCLFECNFVLIWVRCIRLKLTFSHGKLNANFGKLNFFLVKAAVKFRNLQISKVLNTDTNRIFPIPFKVMCISLRYT